jgi:predicted RND superfamily exporter protein
LVTAFLGYKGKDAKMSYSFAKLIPSDDPDMIFFEDFKKLFGEDGNVVAIGVKDSSIYQPAVFKEYKILSDKISSISGVSNVVSLPLLKRLRKNQTAKRFELEDIFTNIPKDQPTLDSLLQVANEQRLYSGQIVNPDNGATLPLIAINDQVLNSKNRGALTNRIVAAGDEFTAATGVELHYAGLPFVRSVISGKVKKEMSVFLILSVAVTGLILLLFFRSWTAVVFPMIIIAVVVLWVMGTLVILDYEITILTGLIPPIIVVIGIPNSVYLLNKYHQEFEVHGNKMKAISRVTRKIGLVTLITNFTTAIGFLVLTTTDIVILKEFGYVAGINILATFVVSIILLPAVFSWLPSPTPHQLKHLKFTPLAKVIEGMDLIVHRHKHKVFVLTGLIVLISIAGMYQLNTVAHMVDDIPEDDPIKKDLAFFEKHFSGVMPLEIIVDTGKKRGVIDLKNLKRVEEFEEFLASHRDISNPVSIVSFVKAAKQAFYNNNPDRYEIPNKRDKNYILRYLKNQEDNSGLMNSFVDSAYSKMRISMKVADVGSQKMDSLVNRIIQPKIDSLFAGTETQVTVTGSTPIFIKGNKFLVDNLKISLLLAFVLIAIIMGILFGNIRMIVISLIPNVVPLVITAGIMGYFSIPLKPSTVLIFSIAFGISVDDSIHFLAKYRQELFANNFFVPVAISKSLKETGASMIYTSVILFAGFIIFAWSDFGGTIALGILTSITLLIAMCTNLILLPGLLLAFDDGKRRKEFHPLIEQYDDHFYQEGDDEAIDVELLKVEEAKEQKDNTLE